MIVLRNPGLSVTVLATCLAVSLVGRASEPVEKFLAQLRANGYHDLAVEYLERVVKSPYADEEFRRRYPYELGTVLLEAARATDDTAIRERLAERGLEKLREFVASNSDQSLVAAANSTIAETLLERGRALAARAERSRDKEQARAQARAMLVEAAKSFAAVEKHHLALFERQSADADRETRNRMGAPILEARLRIGDALSETAKTFDAGSAEARQYLHQGIDRYRQLYEKYAEDGFVAAYAARVREAGNYLDLDKPEDALTRIQDVLSLDLRTESLRDLVLTPAYLVALRAWHKIGKFDEAIEKTEDYSANASEAESKRADWLELQYLLALAYREQAKTLKPGDPQRSKHETEARRLAGQVVKYKSDVQNDARLLLGQLGRPLEQTAGGDAKTFAEAIEQATTAIQEYSAAKLAGDSAAEADKATSDRLKSQVVESRDSAYRAAQQALRLADDQSELAKLNTARFYLSYLHWEFAQAESAENKSSSHYFDAAVLGDFLARRFPDHTNARQAMAIALASYQTIRQDVAQEAEQAAQKAGNDADQVRAAVDNAVAGWTGKIAELAEYAIAKWPESDESVNAVAVLAAIAVERQEFEKALEWLEKLKPGSPRRADAQLRIGRAIWLNYARAKRAFDEESKRQAENENQLNPQLANANGVNAQTLAQWAKQAQSLLEAGLAVAKKSGEIDRGVVLGLWSLVQSYVNTSQPEKAIPWLEDESLGLLPLVNNKHEAAEIDGLMFDAYRLALRAYIAVEPQQLDKALATMDALEKITGNDAKGREMLTGIYIAMGRDLQQEIKDMVAAGGSSEVAALSTAFEAFLKRLVSRESGNTFNSLFWVADTYAELGAGLSQTAEAAPADRRRSQDHYRQAVAAFEKIIERKKADPEYMPDKYRPLVETRLAKAYRGAGEYDKALTLLVSVLKDKPNVLDVQFDAAYTYQEYAASDPEHGKLFRNAILGGDKDDRQSIWGWNSLAERIRTHEQRLRRDADEPAKIAQAEQYRQRYQEARFNSAYCAFSLAKLAANPREKKRLMNVAKQGMWSVYAIVDPQFGGGEWKTKNDRLLMEIQSALGEPALGLKEFEQRKKQQAQTAAAK